MVSSHVLLDREDYKESIQEKIHRELRRQAVRVRDIFARWDHDRSNTISKASDSVTSSVAIAILNKSTKSSCLSCHLEYRLGLCQSQGSATRK